MEIIPVMLHGFDIFFCDGLMAPDWRISTTDCLSRCAQPLTLAWPSWIWSHMNLDFLLPVLCVTFGCKQAETDDPQPQSPAILFSETLITRISLWHLYSDGRRSWWTGVFVDEQAGRGGTRLVRRQPGIIKKHFAKQRFHLRIVRHMGHIHSRHTHTQIWGSHVCAATPALGRYSDLSKG